MKWEYRTVKVAATGFVGGKLDENTFTAHLNDLGDQGWELVTAFDTNQAGAQPKTSWPSSNARKSDSALRALANPALPALVGGRCRTVSPTADHHVTYLISVPQSHDWSRAKSREHEGVPTSPCGSLLHYGTHTLAN